MSKRESNPFYAPWKDFTVEELNCSHCGKSNTSAKFFQLMNAVQSMRDTLKFPLPITSGYRCESHPIEKKKIDKTGKAGYHTIAAVDIGVNREQAHKLLKLAFIMGFTGIGINQKGSKRFIHLDFRNDPTIWSY